MVDVFGNEIWVNDYVFIVDKHKEIDAGRVVGFTNTKIRVSLLDGRGTVLVSYKKVGLKNTSLTKRNTKED